MCLFGRPRTAGTSHDCYLCRRLALYFQHAGDGGLHSHDGADDD